MVDAKQVIEVYFVSSLILVVGEVQLVRHLIGEEEGLLPRLFETHRLSLISKSQQSKQGY